MGPTGVLIHIGRWFRGVTSGIAARAGINYATMPEETIEQLLVKGGLAKYGEILFQEETAVSLMFSFALDGAFSVMGFAIVWIISRLKKGQSLFTMQPRSLQHSSHEVQDLILNLLDKGDNL